jgi:hypothetical protein
MFLHRCHLIQGESKGIYHKRNLPCVEAIPLVQFDSDDEENK